MQKWLNLSICRFDCGLEWAEGCSAQVQSYSPGGTNVLLWKDTLPSPVE